MRLPPELKGSPKKEHECIRAAYNSLCPDDPTCIGTGRRALDLAQMAASVLMRLRREGWYRELRVIPF